MLQVCIDDTRTEPNQGPVFILAGFMAREKIWEHFSDEWRRCCEKEPRIGFVKGKLASERKGPFRGWSKEERDRKIVALASLTKKFRLRGVVCLINHQHFANHPGTLTFGNRPLLKNPAYTAVSAVTCAVLGALLQERTREKVRFIYDEEVVSREELQRGYRSMIERLPRFATELVADEPKFADDKKFVPLQAADLFAYYFGKNAYYHSLGKTLDSPIWEVFSDVDCINASLDEDDMRTLTQDAIGAIQHHFGVGHPSRLGRG